jgi:hypothetical protein
MAMEPLPLGFGDMDATLLSSIWPFQEELQPQEVNCRPPQSSSSILPVRVNLFLFFLGSFRLPPQLRAVVLFAAGGRQCSPRLPLRGVQRSLRSLPWGVWCRGQGGLGRRRIRSGLEKPWRTPVFFFFFSLHFS